MDLSAPLLRQNKAVPCLQELKSWLEKQRAEVLPKSPMAEAINYTLNQWEALNIYTCDGNLAIENNIAERAVKPFAIGRKIGCSLVLIKVERRWPFCRASPPPVNSLE